jgi:arylsulfatase A-like enzyme
LSKHGYETFFTGKWHVGGKTPEEAGFKFSVATSSSSKDPNDPKRTRQITQNTLDFLSRQTIDQPFMAYVNYHAVHKPLAENKALVAKYQAKLTTHPPKAGLPKGLEMEGKLENKQIQDDPSYAAMVEGIDASVGRILTFIKDNGFEDNTLVLFSSDNGGLSTKDCTSNLPLRAGKGWLYEGGVRVPTIMKWPAVVKPGSVSNVLIYSTDYFPTFLSAAGIPLLPEDHVDGCDLVPLLKDGTEPSRDTYYWHYPHDHKAGNQPSGSILVGRYKLVTFFRTNTVELYDLENDVSELKDLSLTMPEKAQELLAELQAWQKTIPDISYGTPEKSNPLTGVRKQK